MIVGTQSLLLPGIRGRDCVYLGGSSPTPWGSVAEAFALGSKIWSPGDCLERSARRDITVS